MSAARSSASHSQRINEMHKIVDHIVSGDLPYSHLSILEVKECFSTILSGIKALDPDNPQVKFICDSYFSLQEKEKIEIARGNLYALCIKSNEDDLYSLIVYLDNELKKKGINWQHEYEEDKEELHLASRGMFGQRKSKTTDQIFSQFQNLIGILLNIKKKAESKEEQVHINACILTLEKNLRSINLPGNEIPQFLKQFEIEGIPIARDFLRLIELKEALLELYGPIFESTYDVNERHIIKFMNHIDVLINQHKIHPFVQAILQLDQACDEEKFPGIRSQMRRFRQQLLHTDIHKINMDMIDKQVQRIPFLDDAFIQFAKAYVSACLKEERQPQKPSPAG